MPLYDNAEQLIRSNLEEYARTGIRPKVVAIAFFTQKQLEEINVVRRRRNWEPIEAEIVFSGKHHYDSRRAQGYTIDDMVAQAMNGLSEYSVFVPTTKMTVIRNEKPREDGYGNKVKDEASFECSNKFPRAEFLSVIPRGDRNRPVRQKERGCGCAAPKS